VGNPHPPRPIRIATYNVRHGAPPARGVDRRGLVHTLRSLDVDLLALQEVDVRVRRSRYLNLGRTTSRATGLHVEFARATSIGRFGQYGIALATRTPPHALQRVALPSFGMEARVAILARVRLGDMLATVAATHLHNRREPALAQLDVVIEALLERPGPHLLLGDLNLGPDPVMQRLEAAGFTTVDSPPTFPTQRPTRRIDWIAGRGVDLRAPLVPPVWSSDHLPLIVTVAPAAAVGA